MAWGPLGWERKWVSEIDPFCRAVIDYHDPGTVNLGDMREIRDAEPVDVLVAGTPCQSFSVAGRRAGLDDPRGLLAFEFLAIARRLRPRWVVFENVAGLLSSDGGRDFGSFLGALGRCGYGFAYRVLDAQGFGVPQRRRHPYVVGYIGGDWRPAAAVLFERASLRGDTPKGRQTGEGIARAIAASAGNCSQDESRETFVAFSCKDSGQDAGEVSPPLRAMNHDKGHANAGGQAAVAFAQNQRQEVREQTVSGSLSAIRRGDAKNETLLAFTLNAKSGGGQVENETAQGLRANAEHSYQFARIGSAVRRLTPRECERLQGFPDIRESAIIRIWQKHSSDHLRNCALAEIQNHRSPLSAGNAESDESVGSVPSVADGFPTRDQSGSRPAALSVHIDCELNVLRLLSRGRLMWSASTAEAPEASPLLMPADDFAHLIALTLTTLASAIPDGRAALRQSSRHSSPLGSGSVVVNVSGREIGELAEDVGTFTARANAFMKSIISGPGSSSLNSERTLRTLCYFVAAAISGFIPGQMRGTDSFDLGLSTVSGYTLIPWRGRPREQCPDGPRYRALGNAFAVPVIRWIGERIQRLEALRGQLGVWELPEEVAREVEADDPGAG